MMGRTTRLRRAGLIGVAASALMLMSACVNPNGGSGAGGGDVGAGLAVGAGSSSSPTPAAPSNIVQVSLGETSPTQMFITLSQSTAVSGDVTFQVSNDGAKKHEFVVLRTDIAADAFPIVSFEGQTDRINEDAPGVKNVGETGDMPAGSTKDLVINLKPGHYALVCNLQHHYAMGMHVDFTVTPKDATTVAVSLGETSPTQMFITLDKSTAVSGEVSFQVSNDGTKKHEFVVLRTDIAADAFPIVSFEGQTDRINEDAPGVKNVGETGDMAAGTSKTLVINLKPGHYALVCNLQHHYAMGMHTDFTVTAQPTTTIQVSLGETSPTQMFITLSQNTAVAGSVTFQISNDGAKKHEFVVLSTDIPAGSFPIVSFEGETDRINEAAPGVKNVGETGDMAAGTSKTLVLDLKPGHYALVCNLQHHYAMGMHVDFTVV
jgi:uncharacterized cupredoxin-like copper-binding protein